MSVIHAPKTHTIDARQYGFLAVVAIALIVIVLRLWYIQVVRADDLQMRAVALRTATVKHLAPRGLIYDRNGTVLADVSPQIVLTAKPRVVQQNPWVLDKVARMVGVPAQKLEERVRDALWRPYLDAPIYVGVSIEVATRIAESRDELPGIGVEWVPMRHYPDTTNFAHILGYVWTPSDRDVERIRAEGVEPAEYVGKNGLERIYERFLMGTPGIERVEVDSRRRPQRVVARDNAIPGSKLVLALDAEVQRLALERLRGMRGAVVALDPRSGEVLVLASSPTYDASLFHRGISSADWRRLNEDPDLPLINRAVASRYAPGSTFKIVTALALARSGGFNPNATIHCPGYLQVGNRRMRCMGTHGTISFNRAFAVSCNTYFGTIGMRVGPQALADTALAMGLGDRTGIDLPGENRGIVPSPRSRAAENPRRRWFPGDTANFSVGQGEMSATPIQMASVAAMVANRGTNYRPRLVRSIVPPEPGAEPVPTEKEVLGRLDLPPAVWDALARAMRETVETGTARGLRPIPGVRWGAKTGSAQHQRSAKPHSWLIAYAPIEDPKIAVAVIVEAAGHGSTVAGPIARDVIAAFLRVPETPIERVLGSVSPNQNSTRQRTAAESDRTSRPRTNGSEPPAPSLPTDPQPDSPGPSGDENWDS